MTKIDRRQMNEKLMLARKSFSAMQVASESIQRDINDPQLTLVIGDQQRPSSWRAKSANYRKGSGPRLQVSTESNHHTPADTKSKPVSTIKSNHNRPQDFHLRPSTRQLLGDNGIGVMDCSSSSRRSGLKIGRGCEDPRKPSFEKQLSVNPSARISRRNSDSQVRLPSDTPNVEAPFRDCHYMRSESAREMSTETSLRRVGILANQERTNLDKHAEDRREPSTTHDVARNVMRNHDQMDVSTHSTPKLSQSRHSRRNADSCPHMGHSGHGRSFASESSSNMASSGHSRQASSGNGSEHTREQQRRRVSFGEADLATVASQVARSQGRPQEGAPF